MTPAWAQRREELLSDCIVSPDVFKQMMDRLGESWCPINKRWRPKPTSTPCISTCRGCCPTWIARMPRQSPPSSMSGGVPAMNG